MPMSVALSQACKNTCALTFAFAVCVCVCLCVCVCVFVCVPVAILAQVLKRRPRLDGVSVGLQSAAVSGQARFCARVTHNGRLSSLIA